MSMLAERARTSPWMLRNAFDVSTNIMWEHQHRWDSRTIWAVST